MSSPTAEQWQESYIQRAKELLHIQQQTSEYRAEMFEVLVSLLDRLESKEQEALGWLIRCNCENLPASVIYSPKVHGSAS